MKEIKGLFFSDSFKSIMNQLTSLGSSEYFIVCMDGSSNWRWSHSPSYLTLSAEQPPNPIRLKVAVFKSDSRTFRSRVEVRE